MLYSKFQKIFQTLLPIILSRICLNGLLGSQLIHFSIVTTPIKYFINQVKFDMIMGALLLLHSIIKVKSHFLSYFWLSPDMEKVVSIRALLADTWTFWYFLINCKNHFELLKKNLILSIFSIKVSVNRYLKLSVGNCYWSAEKQHKGSANREEKARREGTGKYHLLLPIHWKICKEIKNNYLS